MKSTTKAERTVLGSGELVGQWYEMRGHTERHVTEVEIFLADFANEGHPSVRVQTQQRIDILDRGYNLYTGMRNICRGNTYNMSWDGNPRQVARYAQALNRVAF